MHIAIMHCDCTLHLSQCEQPQYLVIPIGICNVPATFQQLMNLIFSDLTHCMTIYLDDILEFGPTIE